jgi:hypothetical protein
VKPGDELSIELQDDKLVIEAQRRRALDALEALRRAFQESGVTEEDFLQSGREIRDELFWEKYGHLIEGRQASRSASPRPRRRKA